MSFSLRIIAIALVVAALAPRASTQRNRVLVVALDGARLATVRTLIERGMLPHLAAVLGDSDGGPLRGGSRREPRGFWRAALSADTLDGEGAAYVWQRVADAGVRAVAVALPETTEVLSPSILVLPGADEVAGFIGDNAGHVVDLSSLERSGVDWPYDAAAGRAIDEARALVPGGASDWITLRLPGPDGRDGIFRIYRLDDATAYFSPVYRSAKPGRRYVPATSDRAIYVPDDPAWAVDSPRLRDYFYRHVRDLTSARADLAIELAKGRWPLLVYFDPLLGLVDQAYPDDRGLQADAAREAYETVDTRIGALIAASGSETAIVVIGRESGSSAPLEPVANAGQPTGFLFVDRARENGTSVRSLQITRVGNAILGLMGFEGRDEDAPIEILKTAVESEKRGMAAWGVPFTAASLRRLGLVSEVTHAPAAANGAASAATSVRTD